MKINALNNDESPKETLWEFVVLSQSTDLTAVKSSNKTPWLAKKKKKKQFGSNLHGLGCSGAVPVQP